MRRQVTFQKQKAQDLHSVKCVEKKYNDTIHNLPSRGQAIKSLIADYKKDKEWAEEARAEIAGLHTRIECNTILVKQIDGHLQKLVVENAEGSC